MKTWLKAELVELEICKTEYRKSGPFKGGGGNPIGDKPFPGPPIFPKPKQPQHPPKNPCDDTEDLS